MIERVLTADLGNSAIKLVAWDLSGTSPALVDTRRVAWGEALAPRIEELGSVLRVLTCRVAAEDHALEFVRACEALAWPTPREPELDLAIECREPHTIGRDRLFAARGAWALAQQAALVVDAGTALTVDALGVGADGEPCFLGGAIAPGPGLLAEALGRGAAQLFEVQPDPAARALGKDSREALTAGVSLGFIGAAKELVQRVSCEAGLELAPLFLCGGAAPFLLEALGRPELRHEPELVALGLLAADAAQRAS